MGLRVVLVTQWYGEEGGGKEGKGVVFDWGVDPGFIIKSWAGVCWAKDWVWI